MREKLPIPPPPRPLSWDEFGIAYSLDSFFLPSLRGQEIASSNTRSEQAPKSVPKSKSLRLDPRPHLSVIATGVGDDIFAVLWSLQHRVTCAPSLERSSFLEELTLEEHVPSAAHFIEGLAGENRCHMYERFDPLCCSKDSNEGYTVCIWVIRVVPCMVNAAYYRGHRTTKMVRPRWAGFHAQDSPGWCHLCQV